MNSIFEKKAPVVANGCPVFISDTETLGCYINRYLPAKNISPTAFAVRAGVDVSTMSRITNPNKQQYIPSLSTFIRLVTALELSRDGTLDLLEQIIRTNPALADTSKYYFDR